MDITLVKAYPPGTRIVCYDTDFGPYYGRVVVCLCKRHTWQPELHGRECGCGVPAAQCPRPTHVRWDDGNESHEGHYVAPAALEERAPLMRPVPYRSGEAAIYTLEYLIRREGNAYGTILYDARCDV